MREDEANQKDASFYGAELRAKVAKQKRQWIEAS